MKERASITEAERTKIASAYNAQYQKWFKWLYSYNGFPYDELKVNIVAYAVKDKSQFQGSTAGYEVYTELDADGVPMCPVACARDAHLDGDYSGCKASADRHYDHSLWLKSGLEGGFGHNCGQEVGREYFMNNLDSDSIHILLHEMGHPFALDDFYCWTLPGITKFIMLAGASMEITDFDGWMYRNWCTDAAPASSESNPTTKTAASATKTTTPKTTTTTRTIVSKPVSTKKATATKAPATQATSIETTASAEVAAWGQCGGSNWTGATKCTSGARCVKRNDNYSQCVTN
ncbi:endoglucanase type F [Fusarium mundagurra]|uniref:Endoglucanase type F n=1 Tax=Fusarium mundagurra TaxID=1567541 RepID=A0A8H5XUA3_9HYPO|nr:endoglucanase type F [Fusarium mundagurra]